VALTLMLQKRIKHNEAKIATRRVGAAGRPRRVPLRQDGGAGRPRPRGLARGAAAGELERAPARHRSLRVRERAGRSAATLVDLPTLLAESDVVSLHASLTDETCALIGEKALRA